MRNPCTFRESDVRRAIRAAQAAGIEIACVEIDRNGRIVLVRKSAKDSGDMSGTSDAETRKPIATGAYETPEELRKLI